ncbi:MAG: SRPBCC family protein [Prevotellaceae bacterium]|jgi:carbon monoxide dehydrogenase subunit G|nr:SRPBCC family protein [Prevotellaceae bacterium]
MTKYESRIKTIPASQQTVYETLSDLNNLEKFKHALPEEKVKNLSFDAESLTIEAAPMGKVTLHIIEKEPCKCIKFETTTSPLPFNLWIQILPTDETECKMRLTIGLELNPFMKSMVQKPLQEALEKMADMLALIPYHAHS